MIRTRRVTRSGPDAAILFLDEFSVAQAFIATIAPFITHSLVQAFGEGLCQPVGDGLRHDRVVIVIICLEPVAELSQTYTAGYGEGADVIAHARFSGCNEVCQ